MSIKDNEVSEKKRSHIVGVRLSRKEKELVEEYANAHFRSEASMLRFCFMDFVKNNRLEEEC